MRKLSELSESDFIKGKPAREFEGVCRTAYYIADIPEGILTVLGKAINRVTLLTVYKAPGRKLDEVGLNYLILHYGKCGPQDYFFASYHVISDRVPYSELEVDLKQNNGAVMHKSHMRTREPHKAWAGKGISQYYNPAVKDFYNVARAAIADISKSVEQDAAVVSIGCGEGDDLILFCEKSSGLLGYGLDMQPINIKVAKEKYPQHQFSVFEFDPNKMTLLDELDKIRHDAASKLNREPESVLFIVNAVGFVARSVLPGTFAATRFLQMLRVSGVRQINLASLTESLVYPELLVAAGFSCVTVKISNDLNGYRKQLQPLSFDDYCAGMEARCLDGNIFEDGISILDLSLTAEPIQLLDHFLKKGYGQVVETIDLSWVFIQDDDIALLKGCLSRFQGLKSIYISVHEKRNDALFSMLQNLKIEVFLRSSQGGDNETDALPPFMHQMTHYQLMPLQRVPMAASVLAGSAANVFNGSSWLDIGADDFDPYKEYGQY